MHISEIFLLLSFSENYNNRVWKNQILSKKKERNLLSYDETEVKTFETEKKPDKDQETMKNNKVAPAEWVESILSLQILLKTIHAWFYFMWTFHRNITVVEE